MPVEGATMCSATWCSKDALYNVFVYKIMCLLVEGEKITDVVFEMC